MVLNCGFPVGGNVNGAAMKQHISYYTMQYVPILS